MSASYSPNNAKPFGFSSRLERPVNQPFLWRPLFYHVLKPHFPRPFLRRDLRTGELRFMHRIEHYCEYLFGGRKPPFCWCRCWCRCWYCVGIVLVFLL